MKPVAGGIRPLSFPQMVDQNGTQPDRPTFEQLRSLGAGGVLNGFAEYTQGLAPPSQGKTLKQMLLGGGGAKDVRLGAYLANLRQLLTSEATPTFLAANLPKDVKGGPSLRALLDADPNDHAQLRQALAMEKDSKNPVGDLTFAAGKALFEVQRAGQATGEKYRAGSARDRPLSPEELPAGIYGAINLQLDDTDQFASRHVVHTTSVAPEVHPSVRKMVHADYQSRVSEVMKQKNPAPLTMARLDELAQAAVRPYLKGRDGQGSGD